VPLPEMVANEAATTLSGAIIAGATSLTVASSTGFPVAPFRVRVSGSLTAGGTGVEYMVVSATSGTTWTVTRAAEFPYTTALGFATGVAIEHVVTAAGLFEAFGIVNVAAPRFNGGVRLDDSTDNTVALQAAYDYAATLGTTTPSSTVGGATVWHPPGFIRWGNPSGVATNLTVGYRTKLLGAGRGATIMRRMANVSIRFWGSAPADTGPRNIYSGIEHMHFEGGDFNASLIDMVYVSQFQMRSTRFYGCGGSAIECVEVWDSSFDTVFMDWCGSTTNPALWIRNSRATTPTFGWSTDSSNQLKFTKLHIETYTGCAVRIEPGTSNSAPPNGIYFVIFKAESAQIVSGSTPFYIDQACQSIHLTDAYFSLNAFASGSTVGVDVITNNSAGQVTLREIEIASSAVPATSLIGCGIKVNTSGSNGYTVIDNVTGIFGAAPLSGGLINVVAAARLELDHLSTNLGAEVVGFQQETQQRSLVLTGTAPTTASTSIADIAGLSFSNVLTGTYTVELTGAFSTSGITIPRFAFGGTATFAAPIIGEVQVQLTSTATPAVNAVTAANTLSTASANTAGAVTNLPVRVWFTFTVTATGTVTLRWASNAAVTSTLVLGSWAMLSRHR
jgi:hypothetical protein